MTDLPLGAKEGDTYSADGQNYIYIDGSWRFVDGIYMKSRSSSAQRADEVNRQRGMILYQVDDSGNVQVNPNLPEEGKITATRMAIEYGIVLGGNQQTVQTSDNTNKVQTSGSSKSRGWKYIFTGRPSLVETAKDETNIDQDATTSVLVPTDEPPPTSAGEWFKRKGESEYLEQQKKIWGDIPIISEWGAYGTTQLYVGTKEFLAGVEQAITGKPAQFYGDTFTQARTTEDLMITGGQRVIGTGAGAFTTGAGVGTIAFGGVAATGVFGAGAKVIGENALITAAKVGTQFYIADVGLTVGMNSIDFEKGTIDVGKGLEAGSKKLNIETYGKDVILGGGLAAATTGINTNILKRGHGVITTSTLIGASSGAIAGSTIAFYEKDVERTGMYAGAGAVIGGSIGAAGGYLESKGIKPVVNFLETRDVNVKTGTVKDTFRGIKIGYEQVNPKTGEFAFKGIKYSWNNKIGSDTVAIPKGIAETQLYTGSHYQKAVKGLIKEYYAGKIDQVKLDKSLTQALKGDKEVIMAGAKKSGGVFGGSTVERAIGDLSTTNPRFADKPPGDVDLVFHSIGDFTKFTKTLPSGSKITETKLGLDTPEGIFTKKYEIITPKGAKLDVSVMGTSAFMPKAPSPLSQHIGIGTFSKLGGKTTYSAQQQVASKFMTVGSSARGQVKVIEPGKEKYISDISAFGSKSRAQTIETIESLGYSYSSSGITAKPISTSSFISIPASFSKPHSFQSISSGKSRPMFPSFPSLNPSQSSMPSHSRSYSTSSSGPSDSGSDSSSDSSSPSPPPPPSVDKSFSFSESESLISRITFSYKFEFPRINVPPPLPLGGFGTGFNDRSPFGYGRKRTRSENLDSLLRGIRISDPKLNIKLGGATTMGKKKKRR